MAELRRNPSENDRVMAALGEAEPSDCVKSPLQKIKSQL